MPLCSDSTLLGSTIMIRSLHASHLQEQLAKFPLLTVEMMSWLD
jgi:hypothetical protein